jgi:hypothetical protein
VREMSGYLSSRKLGNVKGRIRYMTDEKKQENILDYYNTTNNDFWSMLAKESRERHRETKTGGKCCEARELIIGIPPISNISAKDICNTFKNRYGVECTCAIHYNKRDKIENKHCHLIFSEREKLSIPKVIEEKRALRTYYYDSKGHKCRKSEAVKVVKKGTVLQKGTTRYFSDKNEHFKSQKFIYECKEMILKELLKIDWSLRAEKQNKELSEKHIGKNNPRKEYIRQNNKLKQELKNICNTSDFIINKEKGTSLKDFKKGYDINNFSAMNYEENRYKVNYFIKEVQSIYKDRVRNEVKEYNYINEDVNTLNIDIDYDSNLNSMKERIISYYEPETKTRSSPRIIEILKERLTKMLERIVKLVHIQDFIYIEDKNKIDIYQDRVDNSLRIESSDYEKEQKEIDDIQPEL